MAEWHDYETALGEHTVNGHVIVTPQVYSPQLDNTREVYVLLPPSYDLPESAERRYPVIYMHDGQNLFDQAIAYGDEWCVDEAIALLAEQGLEVIVVGISSSNDRSGEYSPFADARHGGGKGDLYLDFIAETVKPMIDADFRTLPERQQTGIIGSSMGALISLYAFFREPDVFGFVGALSPAFWFADEALYGYIQGVDEPPMGKVYLDAGWREDSDPESFMQTVWRIRDLLIEKGYQPDLTLKYVEDPEGGHTESAWAFRLPGAIHFLLGS